MGEPGAVDEQPLWQLAVVEGIFLAIAVIIIAVRRSFALISFAPQSFVAAGLAFVAGALLGAVIGFGLLRSPLRDQVVRGVLPLRPVTSAVWSIVAAGILAGVCEEMLFRAALVPWIGVAWSSVLFGIAHSGTARLNEGVTLGKVAYLVVAILAGALLGYVYTTVGLGASMSAHAAFDIAILLVLAPAIAAWQAPSLSARQ